MYFLKNLFSKQSLSKEMTLSVLNDMKKLVTKKNSTDISSKEFASVCSLGIFLGIGTLIFQTIQIIYIILSLGYISFKIIPVAYLAFKLLLLLKVKMSKTSDYITNMKKYSVQEVLQRIEDDKLKCNKTNILHKFYSLIDCTFIGYVMYLLFFV